LAATAEQTTASLPHHRRSHGHAGHVVTPGPEIYGTIDWRIADQKTMGKSME